MEQIISLQDCTIFQQNKVVLGNINLSLRPNEIIYIIGKTGSGKSSLLKTLYGELSLTQGEGSVTGHDLRLLKKKDIPSLRRKIGIVFQDFQLLTDRTVYENLRFVLKATGWVDKTEIDNRIKEVLSIVGLEHKINQMPHALSGG